MRQFSLSDDSWDLHRRAERDRQRHNEKVKEVIKDNLGDIISQQDIITADQGKIIKIPVRGLELPRIRFDNDERDNVAKLKNVRGNQYDVVGLVKAAEIHRHPEDVLFERANLLLAKCKFYARQN